jgi:hypothetical protein
MTKKEVLKFTTWLGRRSYKARLEKFGLARLQEIARENGKKGGRPPKSKRPAKCQPKAGAKA